MLIDFGKLGRGSISTNIEPRSIFMSLPAKAKQYGYLRDVQSEVLKKWFSTRNDKNSIIKMNTGSGKTVIGLLILQSCLNEGKGPVVYVVPDPYLVEQVYKEAEDLGNSVIKDRNDSNFFRSKAILVITTHELVNGKSAYGMRSSGNVEIGSILIDDVHACLGIIEDQYQMVIPSDTSEYKALVDLLYTTGSFSIIILL